jgi:phage-related protein
MGSYIASMWASVAPTLAATWPILAIIAAVALLAGGVYFLVKNWDSVAGFFSGLWEKVKGAFSAAWDWIKNLLFGTSDWILGAVAVFMPIVGIPALIIKHWDKIKEFFSGLWEGVKGIAGKAWEGISGIASSAWEGIKGFASQYVENAKQNWAMAKDIAGKAWEGISGIASSAWEGIKGFASQYVENTKQNWAMAKDIAGKAWEGISGIASNAWGGIKGVWGGVLNFFSGLWDGVKSTFQGTIDWIGGKVEAFIAPFKVIGDVIGGVFNKVGGFFKGLIGGGKESGAALNDAFASGIQSNTSVPGAAFGTSLQTISRQMPHSDAQEGPLSGLTASGRALTDTFASGMDGYALEQKSLTVFSQVLPDESEFREKASLAFSASVQQRESIEIPTGNEGSTKSAGTQTIHIQNVYLQAEDCETLLDFMRVLMQSVNRPEECPA